MRRQQSTAKAFEVSPQSLGTVLCYGLAGEEPWAAWEDPKVGIEELMKSAGSSCITCACMRWKLCNTFSGCC